MPGGGGGGEIAGNPWEKPFFCRLTAACERDTRDTRRGTAYERQACAGRRRRFSDGFDDGTAVVFEGSPSNVVVQLGRRLPQPPDVVAFAKLSVIPFSARRLTSNLAAAFLLAPPTVRSVFFFFFSYFLFFPPCELSLCLFI